MGRAGDSGLAHEAERRWPPAGSEPGCARAGQLLSAPLAGGGESFQQVPGWRGHQSDSAPGPVGPSSGSHGTSCCPARDGWLSKAPCYSGLCPQGSYGRVSLNGPGHQPCRIPLPTPRLVLATGWEAVRRGHLRSCSRGQEAAAEPTPTLAEPGPRESRRGQAEVAGRPWAPGSADRQWQRRPVA